VVFLTSLASGTILTGLTHRISWKIGALDKPDSELKCHQKPTATLGGVAIFLAVIVGMTLLAGAGYGLNNDAFEKQLSLNISRGALLVAGLVIVILGITDDLRHVMPRTKLLFQMLASTTLIGSGLVIHRCEFFGLFDISLGALAVPFTLFWLVGSCNAFNFIDGLDGLASGISLVASLVLAIMGLYFGMVGTAMLALALAGALSAMLLFNLKPALIFLGDSGSQFIGLILGVLSIKIASGTGYFALPAAGLILSIPIIDAFLAIIRRYSHLESPALGDRSHIHHRLQRLGLSVTQTSMVLWV
jgi:UDP-GlcNAc:undecaprenyl-phosphate GlcNAc-1-phosphate transferase